MSRVAVFCGASSGFDPFYIETGKSVGAAIALHQLELVYGGSSVGVMASVADACLAGGGLVTGVLPRFMMTVEVAHPGLQNLEIVSSMHERKQKMADLSDGFLVLPGGFGTLDEMFEILTWRCLNLHQKPIGLLNVRGYFDGLITFIEHAVQSGFIQALQRDYLIIDDDPQVLLRKMGL